METTYAVNWKSFLILIKWFVKLIEKQKHRSIFRTKIMYGKLAVILQKCTAILLFHVPIFFYCRLAEA